MIKQNNVVSIVITCKSIIGIVFFNLSKTILSKKVTIIQNETKITQNNFVSIVISCKSIIGFIFFNLIKTI